MSELTPIVEKNDFTTSKFNSKIKFSPVMEEVLLTLLVFFILNGNKIMKDVVSDLKRLLKRSPNSVGTALKTLSTLDIISYNREGHYRVVNLHIDNEFVKSLLTRFFGMHLITKNTSAEELIEKVNGFYPMKIASEVTKNFQFGIRIIEDQINKYQSWLDWHDSLKEATKLTSSSSKISDIISDENNLLTQFSQKIISKIEEKQGTQTAKLTSEEISKIISKIVQDHQKIPPWSDAYSRNSYNPLIVYEDEI